jgi:DNA processing protein
MAHDDERLALLALTRVASLGPARVRALLALFGSAVAATGAAKAGGWPPLPRMARDATSRAAAEVDLEGARAELARARRVGADIVVESDAAFPASWATFPDLPPLLYVRGSLPPGCGALPAAAVAVVGSRRASAAGCTFAFDLARAVASAGDVVVSGLALGIDAAAHQGALAAPGGLTVAVLAGGVDRPTPLAHAALARKVVEAGGALVSEVGIGQRAGPHAFPRRNRLVAALSRAVLVVEAGEASGANLTAGHAGAYGRDVLVVPARPWDTTMVGNLALLRDGATPVCSVADALGLLGLERPSSARGTGPAVPAALCWAWERLDGTPRTAADVADAAGRAVPEALAALERLVLEGAANTDGARRYRRGTHVGDPPSRS